MTTNEQVSENVGNGAAVPSLHPETAKLVHNFAAALADKLAAAERKYGYSNNWQRADWIDECRDELLCHLHKGDPRDVAAYCAFLWHHGAATKAAAVPSKVRITLRQALRLIEFFGGHDADVTVMPPSPDWEQQEPGLYAYCTDYPEDGADYLGPTEVDDELLRLGGSAARAALAEKAAGAAGRAEAWTTVPPTIPGEYWHWDGQRSSDPVRLVVALTDSGKGWLVKKDGEPILCSDLGGHWQRLTAPPVPA